MLGAEGSVGDVTPVLLGAVDSRLVKEQRGDSATGSSLYPQAQTRPDPLVRVPSFIVAASYAQSRLPEKSKMEMVMSLYRYTHPTEDSVNEAFRHFGIFGRPPRWLGLDRMAIRPAG